MPDEIVVIKLDDSQLCSLSELHSAVHEIYRWRRSGSRVIAIVPGDSAARCLARTALDRAGIPAQVVDPRDIGPRMTSAVLHDEQVALDVARVEAALHEDTVVLIAGLPGAAATDSVYPLTRIRELAGSRIFVAPAGYTQEHERKRVPPSSVLLLGLGTVGGGAYQRITEMAEQFTIVGALVRDPAKHVAHGIPLGLLHSPLDELADVQAQIVIDALPQLEPSLHLIRQFLARGTSVVSANKVLVTEAGPELALLAARHGALFLYSAAVGGSAPMVEAVQGAAKEGQVSSICGILNGTSNYVLERCFAGLSFDEAIRAAQEAGFAEADPAEDLSGRDAGRKLQILARHAFGRDLDALAIESLSEDAILEMRAAAPVGSAVRLVARAWRSDARVLGRIRLEAIDANDKLASVGGEWNRLVITRANGTERVVTGRGAGRWPTTEAIIADLLDVRCRGRSGYRQ